MRNGSNREPFKQECVVKVVSQEINLPVMHKLSSKP